MSQYVSGNTVRVLWTVLNESNVAVTGITTPADITFTLHADTGSGFAAASETVSWTEVGVTGTYYISFTPLSTGRYTLQAQELGVDAPLGRRMNWDFDILSAGSVFTPTLANAFCSESDIERWMQQSITSLTAPSSLEAAGFGETRAAILMSLCNRLGYPVTPTTVASGSILQDLLREANAIGAAADCVTAASFSSRGGPLSGKVEWLNGLWVQYVGGNNPGFVTETVGLIEKEIKGNLVSLGTDYILSGDTLPPADTTAPTSLGIQVTMGDVF